MFTLDQPVISRDEELLSEFAELAMDLARDLHASAKAASDPAEMARLAQEVHRMGRGLRQTLLVKSKLQKDQRGLAREDAVTAREAMKAEVVHRHARVRRHVARVLVETFEDPDRIDEITDELEQRLLDYARDLATRPVADVIDAICRDLGIAFAEGDPRPPDMAVQPQPPRPASTDPPDNAWT